MNWGKVVYTFVGIALPFVGTALGAACVFFVGRQLSASVKRALNGFAAGVMVAASVWSLLLPSIEQSSWMGVWSFVPAVVGFLSGVLFLMCLERFLPLLQRQVECRDDGFRRATVSALAVTLHNLPEGMAVGVVYAAIAVGNTQIAVVSAISLSIGIAVQNFPEGAIVSLPLHAHGVGKGKAFVCGVLSGVIEPIGAVITLVAASFVAPLLPYLLAFAAGAMMFVVVEELVPECVDDGFCIGTLLFAVGFCLMMALDVALG